MIIESRFVFLLLAVSITLTGCQTAITVPSKTIPQYEDIKTMPTLTVSIDSDGDGVPDDLDRCPNTQQNAVVDERGCHITTGPDKRLKIEHRAFFADGSSELLPRYQAELDIIASRMDEHKTATMHIEGHISKSETDNNDLANQSNALARNRAMIIKNYLIMKHKIAAERIMTYDCGTEIQIAPNDTVEGRHMNRRVYSIITEPKATEPTVTEPAEEVVTDYPQYIQSKVCTEF
ncbi:OmpA family protein [Psychrobacter sp. AH5]|uniref:OmpA family protein n=1 Tax=Psychrobacter sp. AH5 TaxID=2937433 RepID=UPI00333F558D